MRHVVIQEQDFAPGDELNRLVAGRKDIGAAVSFVGFVRDMAKDASVVSLTLDHYPGMTERELAKIADEAQDRWPIDDVLIVHRIGKLLPGERIVLVITLSAHRRAAFEACDFIMDFLKTRAPFWKKEETDTGDNWLKPAENDLNSLKRWDQTGN